MKKLLCFLFLIPFVVYGAGEISSPNMSMPIPAVGITKGPIYATDINNSLLIIDKHDHSPGNGVPVTPSGLNISSDLSIVNHNLTNVRAARLSSQIVPITSVSPDIAEIYAVLGDLYYNDAAGHQIQITSGGSVAGASGTITGLPSGTASAAYQSIPGTFQFSQATSTPANMDIGTLILRYPGSYPTPTGNYISIQTPSALSTGFALTLPPVLPTTTGSWMTSDTSGNFSWSGVDNSTLQYSSNVVSVKPLGITASQIANNTVTRNQEAAVGQVAGGSNSAFSTTSTSLVNVTGLSVTITTTGRPVMLLVVPQNGLHTPAFQLIGSNSSSCVVNVTNTTNAVTVGKTSALVNIGVAVNSQGTGSIASQGINTVNSGANSGITAGANSGISAATNSVQFSFPFSLTAFDTPTAGTYTYQVQASVNSGTTLVFQYYQLIAYEL